MAEAAISSLVKLLGDVVMEKVESLRGVEGQVRSLKKELERMQAFLKDANKKQYEDERVRQWISEIRELALDAQDTLETFVVNVENKRSEGLLKRCTGFPERINHLERLGGEVDSILKDLEAIKRSRDTYGIKDLGEAAVVDRTQVEVRRRQIEQHPVGLEGDVRKLLRKSILDEKRGLSIAVVEGMGGIGKSTLARKIYNHPDVVGGRFEFRAWVVVTSEFTPLETIKQLILELILQLTRTREDTTTEEEEEEEDIIKKLRKDMKTVEESTKDNLYRKEKLQQMLHKQLEGMAYFIVLDDVWEEQHWESLRAAFPTTQQDKKSRLLITTRNIHMTKYGQYAHKMKVLDPEKSWALLLNKTFIDGKCPKNLESVGKQILEKCKGLPLAISVVGGLLVGKQHKSAWEQVLDQINRLLGTDKSSVLSILELSYHNLSSQLKSCFLCLALFKEDAIISMTRLMHIWVGQGLIQQKGRTRVDEIARGYLDELINRNMVQIKSLTFDGRVKNCLVHDLVREMCLRKAMEEIGLEIRKAEEKTTSIESSSRKPRHCVVYGGNLGCFLLQHNKNLHSLFLVDAYDVSIHESRYWKSFQLLKILDLGECQLKRLPRCFRTLIGLKCLRIDLTSVLLLPRWLEDLTKLEVIDMQHGGVIFSKGKMKMKSLRYLRAFTVWGMTSIEDWKNIETFRDIPVGQWLRCSSELIGSCPIRDLGIKMDISTEYYESSMIQASIEKMENLVQLCLVWSLPRKVKLLIPQVGSLTKLKLNGPMTKFPSANVFPPKLSHLTLENSQLEEDPMTKLGKLPNLVFLKLLIRAYKGERMKILHDGFPSLEALSLSSLNHLRGIDIEEGGLPQLTHLRIYECNSLNTKDLPKHIIISN